MSTDLDPRSGTPVSDADAPDPAHARPEGASGDLVAALGRLSEILERVERARGALYEFHQLMGGADAMLDDVVAGLRASGQEEWARHVECELVGRNVLPGMWTFQVVEAFDDTYYEPLRASERTMREELMAGRRHVYEAELKQRRRRHRAPGDDGA